MTTRYCPACGARVPSQAVCACQRPASSKTASPSAPGWGALDLEQQRRAERPAGAPAPEVDTAPQASGPDPAQAIPPDCGRAAQPALGAMPNPEGGSLALASLAPTPSPADVARAAQAQEPLTHLGQLPELDAGDVGAAPLELAVSQDHAHVEPTPTPVPRVPAAQARAERIAAIARYGSAPEGWLRSAPYFVRVFRRKHALTQELAELVQQRLRCEQSRDGALRALGEALLADPAQTAQRSLAAQVRAVALARQQLAAQDSGSKRSADSRTQELATLCRAEEERRQQGEPIATQLRASEQRLSRAQALRKAREAQLQQAKRAHANRAHSPETAVASQPSGDELEALDTRLASLSRAHAQLQAHWQQHTAAIEELQARKARLCDVAERDAERQKALVGTALATYHDALMALARAGLRAQLQACVPQPALELEQTEAALVQARSRETLQRAAIASYDQASYTRGLRVVYGGALAVFGLFLLLIVL